MSFLITKEFDASSLFAAAKLDDTSAVLALLKVGVDPGIQDTYGRTALHYAVSGGHAETAACLLANGANHQAVDQEGRRALSPEHTPPETLHAIRQRYQRFRTLDFNGEGWERTKNWVTELTRRGILRIAGLIDTDSLRRMQSGFEQFVCELDEKLQRGEGVKRRYDEELHWWPDDRAYVTNNAFKYSVDLVRFCYNETLLDVVNLYLGKPAFIQRGVAMRYLPSKSSDREMFNWHHDMEDKRLKVMILLTDIGDGDQYMSYIPGSQNIFHPYEMFFSNPCTPEYCRTHLGEVEIFKTIGRAGDIFLFDSNGAHRGNRRPEGALRDAVFIEFAANKAQVWGGDIDRNVVESVSRGASANPFARMLTVEKKWNLQVTRKAPTWIETLPRVETWL